MARPASLALSTLLMALLLVAACQREPSQPGAKAPDRRGDEGGPSRPLPADNGERAEESVPGAARRVVVTRVIDGDTIEVRWQPGGRRTERVRLIGVNAPEIAHPDLGIEEQPFGREAAEYTKRVLEENSREAFLTTDVQTRDRYGRLLAYVWLAPPKGGGEAEVRAGMLNARLLLDGYAQVMTVPPNVAYADMFRRFQAEARAAGRGLWGERRGEQGKDCDPSYPDVCIPPPPPDLDCGDIPHRRFRVVPPDPHRFDRDGDGVGCER